MQNSLKFFKIMCEKYFFKGLYTPGQWQKKQDENV